MVDLLAMLDTGQIEKVDFLFRSISSSNEKENCQRLANELTAGAAGFLRTDSRQVALDRNDGRPRVHRRIIRQSSCLAHPCEQITIFHDRAYSISTADGSVKSWRAGGNEKTQGHPAGSHATRRTLTSGPRQVGRSLADRTGPRRTRTKGPSTRWHATVRHGPMDRGGKQGK